MLLSLRIENFALIDNLELELFPGLNIMTGETGAGKSIILDAIDAALGGKVSSRMLRTGTNRALIEATFQTNPQLSEWLASQEIDLLDDGAVICSREITSRSNRTRLNGVVVNKQQIQELREQLVEITAQGQTFLLGREAIQREWLDSFGGIKLLDLRQQISQLFEIAQRSHRALKARQDSDRNRLQQIDLLQYQLKELDAADLSEPDELENLESDRMRLSHSVELQQQSYQVYEILYQNDAENACADLLGKAESILTEMVAVDGNLQGILELVTSALTQVEEAGREINAYGDNLESEPEQLEQIEDRIRQLKQICRKYGATLQDAIAYAQKLRKELDGLTNHEQSIEELEKIAAADRKALVKACHELTQLRQVAATQLEQKLVATLKSLAMEKVLFRVTIAAIEPNTFGADRVTFEFSPNPGEPLQPLSETASGGEISRFLLALKTCFAQADPIGTMVFDEIDVGVSGRVSQAIALQLWQLSRNRQVLCVTHQPIVAAIADHHFRVSKQVVMVNQNSAINSSTNSSENSNGNGKPELTERTTVQVQLLEPEQRKQELAQIAGGVNVSASESAPENGSAKSLVDRKTKKKDPPLNPAVSQAIAFAESLLTQAAAIKNSDRG
ncbi:DNA repair protein RecN [Tumidithrix helvetica PCC 7403]|uniref:DNA repair protein RecN n=1 Tax=Tumidithrix helvetica TaxID=3457545 RepID=UPI003CC43F85